MGKIPVAVMVAQRQGHDGVWSAGQLWRTGLSYGEVTEAQLKRLEAHAGLGLTIMASGADEVAGLKARQAAKGAAKAESKDEKPPAGPPAGTGPLGGDRSPKSEPDKGKGK